MSSNRGSGCLSIFKGKAKAKDVKFEQFEAAKENTAGDYPYAVNEQFLSPDEYSFYKLAVQVLHEKYTICPKVSMAELLFVTNQDQAAFNRISRKRIDFVVCDSETMTPIYAIELDDKSHDSPQRQERDLFLDNAFKAARLPLIHIKDQRAYTREELIMQLLQPLSRINNRTSPTPAVVLDQTVMTPPVCPKCGKTMVMRTASAGPRTGKKFWGCVNYPNCRITFDIPEAG
jgi:hypothetical protein